MEKYEFRTKQPLWIWITAVRLIGCVSVYAIKTHNYFLIIMWSVYYAFSLSYAYRVYTITPDTFVLKQGWLKPRTFRLEDITSVERKYTKEHHLSSLVIRYSAPDMHHNFFEIKKCDTDVEGILNAILDYHPSVSVR